jgi:tRNA(Arg) A34 adenosine deaminase TadA
MIDHKKFMIRANQLAQTAAKKGNHPFGALLVHNNKIILEAKNTVNTDKDFTRHAELNLVVLAERDFSKNILQESTLYASTAPCIMCAAAIWRAGIRKVIYGVKYETYASHVPGKKKYVTIEQVFELLHTPLDSTSGIIEKECLETYKIWP